MGKMLFDVSVCKSLKSMTCNLDVLHRITIHAMLTGLRTDYEGAEANYEFFNLTFDHK